MKPHFFCLLLILALIMVSCSTINVNYDYDQEVDFATIKTFGWRQTTMKDDALEANPLLKKRVIASIEKHLVTRGYKKANNTEPDVHVIVHAGMQEKMRVTNLGGAGGYYASPQYGPWWGGNGYGSRIDVSYYTEGTLIIDIVAAKNNELIWRGAGTGLVKTYKSQEKMQQNIDTYVAEILDHFPPENEKNKGK